ncbi:MAG TPA: hypothetical protein VJ816_08385 [Gemmatimonadales bacterium]|nr:hypothetical protein [Gemmatimonadales bacterium]
MWGIPDWGFGAALTMLGIFGGIGLMLRMMPADMRKPQRRKGLTDEERGLLEEAEHRLGEIEDLQRRVAELEGRVDFAERLLTKAREER